MASPTPAAIRAIQTQVGTVTGGFAGNTDQALADALNAPAVANPAAQAIVPKLYNVNNVLGQIGQANQANLIDRPPVANIRDDINARNTEAVTNWGGLLLIKGYITQAEHDAILAVINATEPDPSYQAQIGWAQANLGRPADVLDIYAARVSS